MLIFWTFAFPIILATFFNLAFSDIEKNEKLDIIDIAIVDNHFFQTNLAYQKTFQVLGDENSEERLFQIQYVDEDTAKELLEKQEITGYLLLTEENIPKVVVHSSGINETVFQYVIEEIESTFSITQHIMTQQFSPEIAQQENLNAFYARIYQQVLEMSSKDYDSIKDISSHHLSYTMIEFYTLIAMACLYGGILGLVSVNQNLANMSSTGKRVSVSPVSKGKLIFSSILASYLVQLIGIALLFFYTTLVLHVDYGNHLPFIILLTLVGSLAGLTLGVAIACLFKVNDTIKSGIILSFTMFGCFLSGMMGITMKYIVDKNVPIVNQLNPASMITDGFYSLYYYDTFDRFYFNIVSLLIFSCIMIGLSILSLRRQKYDSI